MTPCASRFFALLTLWFAAGGAHGGLPLLAEGGGVPSLAPMLERVTPAVVNIAVIARSPEYDNPLLRDPFFRRFFGLPQESRPQVSAGSGVIVDAKKGVVLTNHHVIKDAQEVVVTTKDRRQFKAKVVGSDAGTDIALLTIEAENLTAIPIGDSDALQVGDFVVAIGNPFGLGQTVTSGIISALGRSGLNIEGYEDFIQTDASINPGNSGGALVNLKGELIGINTAIIGPAGGNVGIGFAVPSVMARSVMGQLIRFGEVRRGRFGITVQDVTPDLAKALGTPANEGAAVVNLEPGGPAERAGLKPGDLVLEINGRPVRGAADLRNQLALVPVGEELELKVSREGRVRSVKARIEEVKKVGVTDAQPLRELPGATVGNLRRGGKVEAVGVLEVEKGSNAWYQGLRTGDIIVGVNRKRVNSVKELSAALRASERTVVLRVVRGDSLLTIVMQR